MIRSFLSDTDGIVAIEYGLIASLLAVTIILSVSQVGGGVENILRDLVNMMDAGI